jgi:pimeloyl-ACP methyl ester carboxylesterase
MTFIYRDLYSAFNQLFRFFLFTMILLSACSQEDDLPPVVEPDPSFLSGYEALTVVPVSTTKTFASFFGLQAYVSQVKYDITLYKISYQTHYHNEEITASGLIAVPIGQENTFPLLSAHHGTIFSDEDAPSNFSIPNNVSGFELLASFGYITLIPDYLGYGDSREILHPYYDFEHTAGVITDFIQAAKEFLLEIEVEENGQLFLLGYSEGGYATVAAMKAIEENPLLDLEVTAAAAGAGGYDIVDMVEEINTRETYSFPAYLALVVSAYNSTNQWDRPLTDFFQEPYASRLENLLDGHRGGGAINAQLTDTIAMLFAPAFLSGLKENTETDFLSALRANSVHDWKPTAPLRLYHAKDDEIIPIANSAATFVQMQKNGAAQIEYFPIDEADSHSTGFQPMLESVIPWFESLRQTP